MKNELGTPLLLIFVDAFPYTHRDYIVSNIRSMSSFATMTPSFGYSINLKTELLAGLNPDEAGFFNEFTYDFNQKKVPLRYRILGWICRRHYVIDSLAHKLYFKIFKKNIFKIPFEYLHLFKKNGTEAYDRSYTSQTVLSKFKFERVLYSDFPGNFRDLNVSKELDKKICNIENTKCLKIFAAYCEVDHKTHELGVGNNEHDSMIVEFVSHIKKPIENFIDKNPQGKVVVFSDHGMSSPENSIKIDLESEFGPASPDTYIYFIDATLVRLWVFQKDLEKPIKAYFKSLHPSIIILTQEDRAKYKITNPEFGDFMFTLEDSAQFAPNFFGRKGAAGMHGYLPSYDSQQGIVIANFELPADNFSPKDFYKLVNSLAESTSD